MDKAIQNSRINSGLYAAEQIHLQKLSIEIDSIKSNWIGVEEKIINLVVLVTKQLELEPKKVIEELQWASDIRSLAAQEDSEDRSAVHILNATILLEHMVVVAQRSGLASASFYPHLLHSLANQYYLETKAIIAGGSIGHRLRVTNLSLGFIDSQQEAIEKRYQAGLDKLHMIQDFTNDPVALAFSELNIVDWKAIFDRSKDISVEYESVYEQFTRTSANPKQIGNLFAKNRVLPAPDLQQSFDEQPEAQQSAAPEGFLMRAKSNAHQHLGKPELNKLPPGIGNPMAKWRNENKLTENWHAISAKITLDPYKRRAVSGDGYRVMSFVTGKDIDILDNGQIKGKELRKTADRIKALSLRPVIRDGKVQTSTILVDFLFKSDELYTGENLVVLR